MIVDNNKISLISNLIKSLTKTKKNEVNTYLNDPQDITRDLSLHFKKKKLQNYHNITNWKGSGIHPIYPYALLTHIQFSMVNDKNFPFPPFGIVHKKEEITCHKELKFGKWKIHASLLSIEPVEKGYEIISETNLYIDDELYWTSKTTAYKKTKSGPSKIRPNKNIIESNIVWDIPNGHGMNYGLISNNIDPIHISAFSAKLMGFKKGAIMHGMWTVARGVSEYSQLKYPFKIAAKFIAPIYIPSRVKYLEANNGFGVYSIDSKRVHLLCEIL